MTNPPDKYQGKYRIPSNRMKGWDYSSPGYYFVTICTREKVEWFGEIHEGKVTLNSFGVIAAQNLEKIPAIYPNFLLESWVVMPNHIHTIIAIVETPQWGVSTTKPQWGISTTKPQTSVSTTRLQKSPTLGMVINQYKTACTKQIHKMGFLEFAWQARFYDHIIRDNQALENIRAYMQGNPVKWSEEKFFQDIYP
jgi:putative transposase